MKLKLGPEIVSSYKRLAYQAWYALAEFVDNSTQAYFNYKQALDKIYKASNKKLMVEIVTGKDKEGDFIRITDNSIGMSQAELQNAVHVGKPPLRPNGRSKYGLGLKTGASWFGDLWTIETKKLNQQYKHKITVDVPKVASGRLDLCHKKSKAALEDHFTIVEIRKLHRKLSARTLLKVKDYLGSLYRRDISKGLMELKLNGEKLAWDADVKKRLLKKQDGNPAYEDILFKIDGKVVSGWAGVLEKGTRKDAGFSIIQKDRVIMGWPDSYRPASLFGDQVGGSNDLVNQRLLGELVLENFQVSHTKDQILFEDGEQEALEAKLKNELAGLRQLALSYRKGADERTNEATDDQRDQALNVLEKEIELDAVQNFLKTYEPPSNKLIQKSNETLKTSIVKKCKPDLSTKFNKTTVTVYLVKDMSPNDPYVLIESTKSLGSVIVIINLAHPHWAQLTNDESILNFIRHCTYDGVSESKAYFTTGEILPDTVKLIKDNLLRIPMTLRSVV